MKEIILALIIACSLIGGGCDDANINKSSDNSEPKTKTEEKVEEKTDNNNNNESKGVKESEDIKEEPEEQHEESDNNVVGVCYYCGKTLYNNDLYYYDYDMPNILYCNDCFHNGTYYNDHNGSDDYSNYNNSSDESTPDYICEGCGTNIPQGEEYHYDNRILCFNCYNMNKRMEKHADY